MTRDMDLLHGPVFSKIMAFVFPLMLTNMLQSVYNAADMIVAGMSNVDGAIGSIGTTGAMVNLFLNIFMGFSVGTNVVVARNIGKKDPVAVSEAVHSSLVVGLGTGLVCMAVGLVISRPLLSLLGDRGHILDLADLYIRQALRILGRSAISNQTAVISQRIVSTARLLDVTASPTILTTNLHIDNKANASLLRSVSGIRSLARIHAEALKQYLELSQ